MWNLPPKLFLFSNSSVSTVLKDTADDCFHRSVHECCRYFAPETSCFNGEYLPM